MKNDLLARGIETIGWLGGLAVAAGSDYVLIPSLVATTGQLSIAIVMGLMVGVIIVVVLGEVSQRIVKALRERQGLTIVRHGKRRRTDPRLPMTSRVLMALTLLTMLAMIFSTLLPPASFK
jgi:hypothetical protein